MYIVLFLLPLLLVGLLVRTLLCKTDLSGVAVALIAVLIGIAASAVLYWSAVHLSVLAFQWNDPITW